MASIFNDLLTFFGLSATAPQTLGELIPWLLSVCIAVGLFLFVFSMIGTFVRNFTGRRW